MTLPVEQPVITVDGVPVEMIRTPGGILVPADLDLDGCEVGWLNTSMGAASFTDITGNGNDIANTGGARLLSAPGQTHMWRSDSIKTIVAPPELLLVDAVTVYLGLMLMTSGGFTMLGVYETDVGTDSLFAFGLSGDGLAVWVKTRSTANRLVYTPSGGGAYVAPYTPAIGTLVKQADQSILVYWQGEYVGSILGSSTGTPSVLGSEVLALGGNSAGKFSGPGLIYSEAHTPARVKRTVQALSKGLHYDFG